MSKITFSYEKNLPVFPIIALTDDKGGRSMLKVEKLNKSYTNGVNTYPVLKDVSLHVKKGEFVGVMGPSGSGDYVKIRLS